MTYTITDEFTVNDLGLVAEIDYTVSRFLPATRYEPAEYPTPEIQRIVIRDGNGKAHPCPDWLADAFNPDPEALLAHARDCDQAYADEAADYWRDRRMDAAE